MCQQRTVPSMHEHIHIREAHEFIYTNDAPSLWSIILVLLRSKTKNDF